MESDATRRAKSAREARPRSKWRTGDLGRRCPWCELRVPKVLERAGILIHPCCGPSELNGWDVVPP